MDVVLTTSLLGHDVSKNNFRFWKIQFSDFEFAEGFQVLPPTLCPRFVLNHRWEKMEVVLMISQVKSSSVTDELG